LKPEEDVGSASLECIGDIQGDKRTVQITEILAMT
jgi:hypothetical protein